ncbi:GlxA family transcriptional regulator [Streptomyces sp. NPDC001816]|uniref:GlxA family transcriptional regulator n=1 Tax=Streptomyces sp. NPDC001816 TaxID=3364612 RepID=UPI00368F7A90
MDAPRRIVVTLFAGVELLDVTGPIEVFSVASQLVKRSGARGYEMQLAAERPGPVRTASGVQLVADVDLAQAGRGADTLMVPGAIEFGTAGLEPVVDPALVDWVAETAPRVRRIASVCAGAHILAAAGLLDGLTVATHWYTAPRLAADHPRIDVDPDPIFVREGRVWTCAGGCAGMDLALALVAEDHGDKVALQVARLLVMYLKRPGGQSQFSVPLSLQEPSRDKIGELRTWIADNIREDLSLDVLADRVNLSVRHFSRVFRAEYGRTPTAYVEAARIEFARRLLEETDRALDDVAAACGIGSVETLHRAFRRQLGTTPAEYRCRFRTRAAGLTPSSVPIADEAAKHARTTGRGPHP